MFEIDNSLLTIPDRPTAHAETQKKQLLMFAYYFPPSSESGAQRPFRFAKYLLEAGYCTHVITATPQLERSPWNHTAYVPSGIRGRMDALMQRLAPYNDQLPWAVHASQAARAAIPSIQPAAIISTFPPLGCHLAALSLKRRFQIPWIADFRDPLEDNPFRSRWWGKPYDFAMERYILHHANAIIANTDAAADNLRRRYPQFSQKIHVIWNGYDPELTQRGVAIPQRAFKVLLHAGSVYGARHPNMLLASLDRLIGQDRLNPAAIRVRLIGDLDPDWVRTVSSQCANLCHLGVVQFSNQRVPRQQATREMVEADYLLLLDLNPLETGLQVPAKVFDYVNIGRPILAFTAPGSPTERILRRSGVPNVCIYRHLPECEVDARVDSFLQLGTTLVNPSDWFREQFDARSQTLTLLSILKQLCLERL